jgi:WD40 repeat protein
MEWGFADASARFYHAESRRVMGHHEHLHQGQISCAKFADSKTLVTAGTDGTVSVWQVKSTPKTVEMVHRMTLFGHVMPVMVMAISRSFSTLVTASNDKAVIIWDLNRLRFVRNLKTDVLVQCMAVSDVSGDILLCAGQNVIMFTINGQVLLQQNVCENQDDTVMSCAFYEGIGNEWLERELVFTGHRRGIVNVWEKRIGDHGFELRKIKALHHVNQFQSEIVVQAAITVVLPMPQAVYTGDDQGRVVSLLLLDCDEKVLTMGSMNGIASWYREEGAQFLRGREGCFFTAVCVYGVLMWIRRLLLICLLLYVS